MWPNIEIKGHYDDKCKEKMNLVMQLNQDKKITILFRHDLQKMGVLDIHKKLNINLFDYLISENKQKLVEKFMIDNRDNIENLLQQIKFSYNKLIDKNQQYSRPIGKSIRDALKDISFEKKFHYLSYEEALNYGI